MDENINLVCCFSQSFGLLWTKAELWEKVGLWEWQVEL